MMKLRAAVVLERQQTQKNMGDGRFWLELSIDE
jgi:hypothetical protein